MRSALLQVGSYRVSLDLTAGLETVRSRTEIRFSCRQPGASTFADLDAAQVHGVTLNGHRIEAGAVGSGGRLQLDGLAAVNALEVDATIACGRGGQGLSSYTDPADDQTYLLANCFPTSAPRVFCCFDQPGLRAELTLSVLAPAGWTCVASGEVLGRPAHGGAGEWRFAKVPAMKPYEFTLCAGPYVTAEQDTPGRPSVASQAEPAGRVVLSVRSRATLAGSPGLRRIPELIDRVVRYYEQILGVPCPYGKLDIAFAPELGPLAMQLPGVMYASESLLQRAADHEDDHVAIVLAHEVAHLWFGCLVEGGWWDDLWLAEAMASYLSYEAATAALGVDDAWAEFGLTGQASAYQADQLPSTQPVSSPVDTAAHALTRPSPITYSKGASVLRQLAALIGTDSMRAGLRSYLTRYAWSATSLTDFIGCMSAAAGRDLTGWARDWLQRSGVNTLRPELAVAADGTIESAAVLQDPPRGGDTLRQHRITIGCYEAHGPHLLRSRLIRAEISGARTSIAELAGLQVPAAIVVNDADLTFAAIRFDEQSLSAILACALNLADPLAESVCWNAAWGMVAAANLGAALFAGTVGRRIGQLPPVRDLAPLLERAIFAADFYAEPGSRSQLLTNLAETTLAAAEAAAPGSRDQVTLAGGFAACASSSAQLTIIRSWLDWCDPAGLPDSAGWPEGLTLGHGLHSKILANLAGHGLATAADLVAYTANDPVNGDTVLATCLARQPAIPAKEAAWAGALAAGQPSRLALAHAQGFWVPGQEHLVSEFGERYFAEALPAVRQLDSRAAQRLARALYPATLAGDATIAATGAELARTAAGDPIRTVLLEQQAILQQVIAARAAARTQPAGPASS